MKSRLPGNGILRTGLAAMILMSTSVASLADKPTAISISGWKAGGANYVEATAIGDAIDRKFSTKIRVIPFGNSVGRALALRGKKVDFWMSCSAYYTAFEGIGDFSAKQWGPQDLRVLLLANRKSNFSFATSETSDIKSIADLKGKRIPWIIGNSGINMQTEAYLAFAGLTLDDVKLVNFPGFIASLRGLISGQVDALMSSNTSPGTMEIAASPGGLRWIDMPHGDTEGWARVQNAAPFVAPIKITGGVGLDGGKTAEVGSYPCPTFVGFASSDPEKAYWLTKMVFESWDLYNQTIKTGPHWQIDNAIKSRFAVPYHEGAVKYFKEVGKWTEAMQAQQEKLLKRIAVMESAYAQARKSFSGKEDDFEAYWATAKDTALKNASL